MQTNNRLRGALTKILDLTNSLDEECAVDPVEIRDIAKAALAEPVKNCEVGTSEEQEMRFIDYCSRHHKSEPHCDPCNGCPLYLKPSGCQFSFAQMPYEEGGNIMGRESLKPQCWECANCKSPRNIIYGSRFYCSFLEQEFGTWHYDVPNECPCKGKGWSAKTKGGAK